MSYEQHLKHWGNHRKDKYYQQCSGYFGDGKCDPPVSNEEGRSIERDSFEKLLEGAKDFRFPAHVFQTGWVWRITDKPNLFSTEIKSYDELVEFGQKYIG